MTGDSNYIVWVENGNVHISGDGWHTETFRSRTDVNAFIELIKTACDEAFPIEEVPLDVINKQS